MTNPTKKSSRTLFLEQQLTTLRYENALFALELVIHNMGREKGFVRHDGEPYYYHLIDVAQILINFGIRDEAVITAALLHDFVEDVEWADSAYINRIFGEKVALLVDKVTKKDNVDYKNNEHLQTYLNDIMQNPEAALIKTADRIHNFSSMRFSSEAHRAKQAIETRTFFIPFFKNCRNLYPKYSHFFFFAKTIIEPILFEIEENVKKTKELESKIKELEKK